eukprot:TRINITY_DN68203_c4_g1_i1.p1 TRINITY_DN68203_c4_g1~~TRINITY_DN68203_c4_g1_i1.p1  ORF type:complete len:135 (-),score=15.79 TRINITY_DN68203_c4_g1_i1:41-445(-)
MLRSFVRRTNALLANRSASSRMWASTVTIDFVDPSGKTTQVNAEIGKVLMVEAKSQGVDIEAACDGTCACSTCHVYIAGDHANKLPAPSEDELDMLDLAVDLKDTSRLSCQLTVGPEMEGMTVDLPADFANHYA